VCVCVFLLYTYECEYDRAVSCGCVNVCDTAAAAAAILHQNEFAMTMPHSQKTDLLFQTVAHCALCCVNQP
jgi:hypothetical protein